MSHNKLKKKNFKKFLGRMLYKFYIFERPRFLRNIKLFIAKIWRLSIHSSIIVIYVLRSNLYCIALCYYLSLYKYFFCYKTTNTRLDFQFKVHGLIFFFFLLEDCFAHGNKRIRSVLAILEKKRLEIRIL